MTRAKRKIVKAASDRLLKKLPLIALELRLSGKLLSGGGALRSIDGELLRELGRILGAILSGEDARRLFRQNERTKPKATTREAIALVYWYLRAISTDALAIERVKASTLMKPPASAATIKKYAQLHRDNSFAFLSRIAGDGAEACWRTQLWIYTLTRNPDMDLLVDEIIHANNAVVIAHVNAAVPPITPVSIATLREYLRKKTRRSGLLDK